MTSSPIDTAGPARAAAPQFPAMPHAEWKDTLATLHRFAQVVGKVRLASSARRNHWWNVPFHLTGRGITTRPMGDDPIFTIDFDFLDHRLDIATTDGARHCFPLLGRSVASFAAELERGLAAVGVHVDVPRPLLAHLRHRPHPVQRRRRRPHRGRGSGDP